QPPLAAADEDRLGVDDGAVVQRYAALLADGEQRPDEVLPVTHPAGDPVQGDVNDLARHRAASRGLRVRVVGITVWERAFPRIGLAARPVKAAAPQHRASDEEVR